jgi:hypothetical protein
MQTILKYHIFVPIIYFRLITQPLPILGFGWYVILINWLKILKIKVSYHSGRFKNMGSFYMLPIKVQRITGHESPKGEKRLSCTLSLNSALDRVRGQRQEPAALPMGNRPGIHCTVGWVCPRSGRDMCGKFRPHRDSIPGPSRHSKSALF